MKHYEISDRFGSWFRLDNSAAVYPMLITLKTQSLFRLGVELTDYIDKDDLEKALKTTFKRYPSFEVELSQGFFRHYFIANHKKPVINPEDGSLLKKIDFRNNKGYLLRVTYYKRKIFVDFFHGLCDGKSAMDFLKTLVYYYLIERGQNIEDTDKVKTLMQEINPEEFNDGFKEHYKEFDFKEGMSRMAGKGAFPIKDTNFKKEGLGLIQGFLDTDKLLSLSKKYDCSLTVFITAIALLSVTKVYYKGNSNYDMIAFLPINLRRFYPSKTVYNFTSFAKCKVNPNTVAHNIESYISVIKAELQKELTKEELDIKVSFTSLMDKKPVLRFMPLFIKSFITKLVKRFTGSAKQTIIISNLGRVDMPKSCEEHIDNFSFMLNCGNRAPKNMGIVSYKDKTVISFSRQIVSTEIEKVFFKTLAELGINVKIVSNLREVNNAL